jgi:hypothetical protein
MFTGDKQQFLENNFESDIGYKCLLFFWEEHKHGKIISKTKFVQEKTMNRLEEVNMRKKNNHYSE